VLPAWRRRRRRRIATGRARPRTARRGGLSGSGIHRTRDSRTVRQFVIDRETNASYNKIETFYLAGGLVEHAAPSELGHAPRWVAVADALAGLREPAQVWALRQALERPPTR
jgi:hypothetical protein